MNGVSGVPGAQMVLRFSGHSSFCIANLASSSWASQVVPGAAEFQGALELLDRQWLQAVGCHRRFQGMNHAIMVLSTGGSVGGGRAAFFGSSLPSAAADAWVLHMLSDAYEPWSWTKKKLCHHLVGRGGLFAGQRVGGEGRGFVCME